MAECRKFQCFGLACLVLAAISGIVGFVIVYHFTQFERPIKQFAIVIDAGSTQTRSSLFSVGIDASSLIDWTNKVHDDDQMNEKLSPALPLTELFQIRQIDTCVNGGPLASIKSQSNANELASKCIKKFSKLIKKLDFESESSNQNNDFESDEEEMVLDSEEVSEQLALLNHRVNSVTHLYLGATAGMRAIEQLNETRAAEKIGWISRAINESQGLVENGPYINKAYVGILQGSEEASFGWTSVNFVCKTLEVHRKGLLGPIIDSNSSSNSNQSSVVYNISKDNSDNNMLPPYMKNNISSIKSVGTLELGGASIQMAYQIPDNHPLSVKESGSLQIQRLDLFNNRYDLVTRSELCLGMSQAILRAYYILLWQNFKQSLDNLAANKSILNSTTVEIENSCLQKAAQISLTRQQISEILNSPCLTVSDQLKSQAELLLFNRFIESKSVIRFTGSGKFIECNAILWNLVEPVLCRNYFLICPKNKIEQSPPNNMPFVTISGYNKALQVLDLPKKTQESSKNISITTEIEQIIADNLGGFSVDHGQFKEQIKAFCSIDVAEFPKRFPKMNKLYYGINCLQLIYINKLLTEFYHFEPKTSWNQIKFLLYPVKPKQPDLSDGKVKSKHQDKNDIGWTLGLLLNATSHRFSNFGTANGQVDDDEIFFHHGATTLFIVRTTIFLMFACCLIAICCIFIGAIVVHHKKQTRSGAYMIHDSYGGTSNGPTNA